MLAQPAPHAPPSPTRPRRPPRQRGFSLIVVFLIIVVMAAVAGTVMVSTQGDLAVSTHDRESEMAFYAAEAAAATAQNWLNSRIPPLPTTTVWTDTLSSGALQLCLPSATDYTRPGVMPNPANNAANSPGALKQLFPNPLGANLDNRTSWTRWCVHNNALDPSYLAAVGFPSIGDLTDKDGTITIEAYGIAGGTRNANDPTNARSWISVDVRVGTNPCASGGSDKRQAGGGPWKGSTPCTN